MTKVLQWKSKSNEENEENTKHSDPEEETGFLNH